MKSTNIYFYLCLFLSIPLAGCQKENPLEKVYYITGGWISTDGFIPTDGCDDFDTGPHIFELVDLNGRQPAKQTGYVYDLFYNVFYFCEQFEGDESIIYEANFFGEKKLALSVLFDETGAYYISSMLSDADIDKISNEFLITITNGIGPETYWPIVGPLGMLHMGFGDLKGTSPMVEGKVANWGADEIVITGSDTLYYNAEGLIDNRSVISAWEIRLEAQ